MKIGIMQPYFFPYIGYWQLMNAVDQYVIFDDVNFINRGWIHRNRILANGRVQNINLPMLGASQNKRINEVMVNNEKKLIEKNLRTLEMAYKKAPYYADVYPLIKQCFYCGKENIADYIEYSFRILCEYLKIKTSLIRSSEINKDNNLKGQDKVLNICRILHADEYYNAIGGRDLYSFEQFRENEIVLKFLKSGDVEYKQFQNEFYPNLSIIDIMMFNSPIKIQEMLLNYVLLDR